MPTVLSEGVRLAVDIVGNGDPVSVIGHGLTGRKDDLALLAPVLPGTKVLFDFRGHGKSERPPPGSYSMNAFAADVDAVAGAFDATRVVGVSLGGGATLRLLISQPDRFERLVFVLPARLERSRAAHERLLRLASLLESKPLEEVADTIVAEEEARGQFDEFPAARERRRESILAMNAEGMPHAIRECIDDPPMAQGTDMARVTAPALVIGQEGDDVHAADVARELAGTLPNAELVVYPDRFALLREVVPITQRVSAFLAER